MDSKLNAHHWTTTLNYCFGTNITPNSCENIPFHPIKPLKIPGMYRLMKNTGFQECLTSRSALSFVTLIMNTLWTRLWMVLMKITAVVFPNVEINHSKDNTQNHRHLTSRSQRIFLKRLEYFVPKKFFLIIRWQIDLW